MTSHIFMALGLSNGRVASGPTAIHVVDAA